MEKPLFSESGTTWIPNDPAIASQARKIKCHVWDMTPYDPEREQIFWDSEDGTAGVSNRTEWEEWKAATGARGSFPYA